MDTHKTIPDGKKKEENLWKGQQAVGNWNEQKKGQKQKYALDRRKIELAKKNIEKLLRHVREG